MATLGSDKAVRAIGRYELVSEIAPGAIGDLWKARIASGPEQGRTVSIRRVSRSGGLDARAVERLTNVGFAAMEVRHPKIGAVLDVVVADSEIAFVSEHIGGALLTALLRPPSGKRPNVPPDIALRIVLDVVEALTAVQSQWRDLFPSAESDDDRMLRAAAHGGLVPDSVLLASFGEAVLLDAGLAGIAMTMHPLLDHAEVIAYRSPEQLEGSGTGDERSDVFTLGVLIWELLAARPLFAPAMMPRPSTAGPAVKTKAFSDAMQVSTVKRKVLSSTIQRLDSLPLLRGKVNKAFADLVARCLEREPSKRYQSLGELADAIADFGPRAVSGYDAVSRLLASVGATAPSDESAVEPGSGRSTSNRPTVPPEQRRDKDSVPPDTKPTEPRGRAVATSLQATPARTKVETVPEEERRTRPGEDVDDSLSIADLKSIPPSANTESLVPTSDIESLPPSGDSRAAEPQPPASDLAGLDIESLPPSGPAIGSSNVGSTPFTLALGTPQGSESRPEETTSAPVVRPVDGDGGAELASTLSSSPSARGANKKVVIGVLAAAGVLAIVGLIRIATSSGEKEPAPLSASAAPSSAPSPPTVDTTPPAETTTPAVSAEAPVPEAPAEAKVAPAPTSAPVPSPAGIPQQAQTKRPLQPTKKKPFRPNAI